MNDPEDDFEPPKKLRKPLQPLNRFNTTVSEAEAAEYAKGYIPKNTKWAVNVNFQFMGCSKKFEDVK